VVSLSDGSSFFIPLALGEGLFRGRELSEEELEGIRRADQRVRAREWAASFLAGKEESSGRLLLKMAAKGFDRDAARDVLDEMKRLGFQDDYRFSEQWLLSRLRRHPESRAYLQAGLMKRGVDRETAAEAVRELVSTEDEEDALARCLDKESRKTGMTPDKLVRRLTSRGFSYEAVKRVIKHGNQN